MVIITKAAVKYFKIKLTEPDVFLKGKFCVVYINSEIAEIDAQTQKFVCLL